jgi:hypothetical protein
MTVSIESGVTEGLSSMVERGLGSVLHSPKQSCGHLHGATGKFLPDEWCRHSWQAHSWEFSSVILLALETCLEDSAAHACGA